MNKPTKKRIVKAWAVIQEDGSIGKGCYDVSIMKVFEKKGNKNSDYHSAFSWKFYKKDKILPIEIHYTLPN